MGQAMCRQLGAVAPPPYPCLFLPGGEIASQSRSAAVEMIFAGTRRPRGGAARNRTRPSFPDLEILIRSLLASRVQARLVS
jgi:hypothetical protein